MARIRTIKPTFFTSEDVAVLSRGARLTWIGLWTYVDDAARGKMNIRLIKAALYPLDDDITLDVLAAEIDELIAWGRLIRYEVDGQSYIAVHGWEHQRINRPTDSVLPPPPERSTTAHAPLTEDSPPEGKGKEGKGGGGDARASTRPDPWCQDHPGGTEKPCRRCAAARRTAEAWQPPTPTLPPVAQALDVTTCRHGGELGRCPSCRREAQGAAT